MVTTARSVLGHHGAIPLGRVRTTERFAVQPIEGGAASDHYGVIVEIEGGSTGNAV
jgi:hypothetical protein